MGARGKRICGMLLATAMILSSVSSNAYAEDETTNVEGGVFNRKSNK